MKGKVRKGNPMLRALLLGVLAFSMAACDFLKDDNVNKEPGKVEYIGTNDGYVYVLTITEKTSREAAYTPKTDDSYTLKFEGNLSSGTVLFSQKTGSTLKFTLKPAVAAADTFTVTVLPSDNKITNVTGTVTFDTGGTKTGPGNLSNSDGGGAIISVTGVTLDLTTLSLVVGGAKPTLKATVVPRKATNRKVTWNSSNSSVVTVSSSGRVTAVSAGSAYIAVITADGGKTASCTVTVYAKGTTVLTGTVAIWMTDPSGAAKDGTPYVGYTLKAETSNLDGSGAISHQWKRGTTNIGNSDSYVVTSADIGSTITVTVTRSGYTGSVTSAPTAAVDDSNILTGTVSITGTAEVGKTLTANTSGLGGTGAISYQWKRGSTSIGKNSSTYDVDSADIGSTITVTVTRADYTGSVTSAPTVAVVDPTLPELEGSVEIDGLAQVGQTLTAIDHFKNGRGNISYQWKRGNVNIGTNSYTYVVATADIGSTITVTVTRSGNSGSLTSAPTDPVKENDLSHE